MNKLIPFMVRQAHNERNQVLAVRPELVKGLVQGFLKEHLSNLISYMDDSTSVSGATPPRPESNY